MHYQCSLAAAAGSRCTGARSGVVTERGSRGIGAAQKVLSPHMVVMPKGPALRDLPFLLWFRLGGVWAGYILPLAPWAYLA